MTQTSLTLSDFDYALPRELVAANPYEDRAGCRLLHVDIKTGAVSHHTFRDLIKFLKAGDRLVLNNTKVLPARIFGSKKTGGKVEALLLKECEGQIWEALLRPGGRVKKGTVIEFGENGVRIQAEVLDESHEDSGQRKIRFDVGARSPRPEQGGGTPPLHDILDKIGHIPLPPYIGRPDAAIDRERYQSVFAEKEGAVASPTAGLHFDQKLLEDLKIRGVEIVQVTLHVGYGTFQPVVVEDLSQHRMFEEEFEVTEDAARKINRAKSEGRRVIACGTTVVRVLETVGAGLCALPAGRQARPNEFACAHGGAPLQSMRGTTRLFIYPPYEFKIVDGLITNFHLPKSSLLMLVAAFMTGGGVRSPRPGEETSSLRLSDVYREAIRERYRFYSFGDAMLIV